MGLTAPYTVHNYLGEYPTDAAALAAIVGMGFDHGGQPNAGQWYFNTTDKVFRGHLGYAWATIGPLMMLYAEAEDFANTTATAFQNRVSLVLPGVPGSFIVSATFIASADNTIGEWRLLNATAGVEYGTVRVELKDDRPAFHLRRRVAGVVGTPQTIRLQWRTTQGNKWAGISDATLVATPQPA